MITFKIMVRWGMAFCAMALCSVGLCAESPAPQFNIYYLLFSHAPLRRHKKDFLERGSWRLCQRAKDGLRYIHRLDEVEAADRESKLIGEAGIGGARQYACDADLPRPKLLAKHARQAQRPEFGSGIGRTIRKRL